MKLLKILPIFLFLYACSTTQVAYDYDEQANFSQYTTYSIYSQMDSGLSPLDEKRMVQSLEKGLQNANLSQAENPNLYINYYTEEYQQDNRERLGIGIGGGGGNVGVGVSGGIPIGAPDDFLRITFDLIDAKTKALVWQAVVDTKFNRNASPKARQEKFDVVVEKALKKYPPKN
ncbi:MAG: DUF4136 domain-containing protein [Salinimicrobium sp.]